MARGDVGVLARLEKETRRADRAQRRLSKAIQKRDRMRGRAVPERIWATKVAHTRFGPLDQAFEPAREANRWCRRLKRATDDEGRREFYCTEVGTDLMTGGAAVLVAPATPSVSALPLERLAKLAFGNTPPNNAGAVSHQRVPLFQISGSVPLFEARKGEMLYARFFHPDASLLTPLVLLTDRGHESTTTVVSPEHLGLSQTTMDTLADAAARLLGLSVVTAAEFCARKQS